MQYDLLLQGGRVIDPAEGVDAVADVAFSAGRVAAVGANLPTAAATEVRDVSGKLVAPGLIDLHTHVYWGATSLGVEAESVARRSGTTTLVDAGSAGAGNYPGFQCFIAEATPLRIYAFLNISFAGIFGFSKVFNYPECGDIRLLEPTECLRVAREYPETILGIKVRVGQHASAASGTAPLLLASEVATELGLPLMTHIDVPPPSRDEVLAVLRPGDILTHCFRPFPNASIDGRGEIRETIRQAREQGISFDIGHGMGSLSFEVARAMIEQGFLPDTISSDVHQLCVDGPAFDNLVTLSKFLCLGMSLSGVIRAATATPAKILGLPDLGTLRVGASGDAAVLSLESGDFSYQDATGAVLSGDQRLRSELTVLAGGIWHEQETGR